MGVIITGIILNVVNDCGLWDKTKDFFKTVKYDFVIYVAALIIIALPFLIMEMSIIKMSSGREYSEVCYYLPEMIDVINVSSKNWLMGGLLTKMNLMQEVSALKMQRAFHQCFLRHLSDFTFL